MTFSPDRLSIGWLSGPAAKGREVIKRTVQNSSKMKRQDLLILASLIALAGLCTASKPVPKADGLEPVATPKVKPTPSTQKKVNPLSIAGIQLGMSVEEINRRLGKPKFEKGVALYGNPWVATVSFEKGAAVWIRGDKVYRNGKLLAKEGLSNEEVAQRLGKPFASWSNGAWCGNCAETEKDYADGLTVTYRLGMMLDGVPFGNVSFDLVDSTYRGRFFQYRKRNEPGSS